jgi:dihydropteroate synthase
MLSLNCKGKLLELKTPAVMGILNITPDSFYDGGKYAAADNAVKQAERMIGEGAAIIDIGAVSTRPNAGEISETEEWSRLRDILPVVRKKFPEIIISVDTWRSTIAKNAVDEGAEIINDISGGQFDNEMYKTVAALKVAYIMMHTQGRPENMQQNPHYENVVDDILKYFIENLKKLALLGVTENIILDPGFGFGKTVDQNYRLLSSLERFRNTGFPVLAGVSRKSMINRVLEIQPADALNGTTVLNTIALLNGADILRVHDVKAAVEVIKLVNFYRKSNERP